MNKFLLEKIYGIWNLEYSKKLKECYNGIPDLNIINPYHKELSVYDHIKMVYEYAKINYSDDYIIQLGALLHDLGKLDTREIKNNSKVTFHNHENIGVFRALEFFEILKSNNIILSDEIKSKLINIVAFHDIYKYDYEALTKRHKPETLEMLCKFNDCDNKGRITKTPREAHVYKDYKLETKDSKQNFVVLVGLPASGKSTYIKNNESFKDYVVLSRDSFIEARCRKGEKYTDCFKRLSGDEQAEIDMQFKNLLSESLIKGSNIIIDKTNASVKSRRILLNSSKYIKRDYKLKAVVFLKDLKTVLKQNIERTNKTLSINVIEKFKKSFYIPTLREFDEIEYVF